MRHCAECRSTECRRAYERDIIFKLMKTTYKQKKMTNLLGEATLSLMTLGRMTFSNTIFYSYAEC